MAQKPKTRIRIGLPKGAPNPVWTVFDLGFGEMELQLGKDIVETMKEKGYTADGQVVNEIMEDF